MSNKHIVCIASEFKGNEFIEEAQAAGWHVTLLTRDDLKDKEWPWTSINEIHTLLGRSSEEEYLRAVVNIAGTRPIDHVVGMDEFDVLPSARIREYLQLFKGMSRSHALRFRDKLTMRMIASTNGVACPEFVGAFNPASINEYLERVPAPWIIKPRTEVSAFGIRKCDTPDQVWNVLTELDSRNTWRDHPSKYHIERFIEGDVYHVDSVVRKGKVVAAGVNKYGTTPFNVAKGGVFTSYTLDYGSEERDELLHLNKKLLKAFHHEKGVAHAEFLKGATDGKFYLVEVACRVGGAYIANVHENANGFNLWREWGKLETETKERPYKAPKLQQDYAGIALALAKDEIPDTSHYADKEIVYRVDKPRHVGLIFKTEGKDRLNELMNTYSRRITEDFLAIAPVKERYDD
ncbi:MAG: ATP-grasp domain-containing protein [Acidobacteriota bacterium]|nr:ATP-grasp domain-containing protein [Acidobacteriota bacterium]MDH3530945.1 ATP-grasp domain-containing protein [Acidobacteriota bacterium]